MLKIDYLEVAKKKVAYKIFGKGKVNVVIEMGLGTTMGEWWHIAEKLSEKYTVLLYERAGYQSEVRNSERSPNNIANELKELIDLLEHEEKIIIIAHSQGALYSQTFCRLYPEMIKGVIFIDPLSANDNKFKTLLSAEEYKNSGVDKTKNLQLMKIFAKLHLGFIIKYFMKSAPPFYYYNEFSKEAKEYILNSETKVSIYETAINEYKLAHVEENIKDLREKDSFPDVPLFLIIHSSETSIKEIMEFGRTTKEAAEKIEEIWQELMKEYLTFSKNSHYVQAQKSSHFIHLVEPELISESLEKI